MTADSTNAAAGEQVIFVTGGYDHTIKLWQAHSGVCLRTMQHPDSQVNALEITPDKQMIAACGFQHVKMYDLVSSNPDPLYSYNGITKNISKAGFQEDGKWMYTGSEDSTARIWDFRSRSCQRIFQVQAPVNAVCLHPNQTEIIIGDQSGIIHLWDLRTDQNEQLVLDSDFSIQDISIDAAGCLMAAVNNRGSCYIWSLTEGIDEKPTKLNPKHKFSVHPKYALRCQFSPDSSLLVTTSGDGTARVWSMKDFSLVKELTHANQRWVWDAAFSADSQYVFTGSSDGNARLWNVNSGSIERVYSGHQKAITALVFRDEII
ncbi:MTOR associated protein, LST8 isoform X2 [Arctopsyche grandis]|uniref:MTOR associated protein, LST8 isoform X2 n=1 Tax=Arctopsyche grandis TaxID=121162 RepID=UPI00406D674C